MPLIDLNDSWALVTGGATRIGAAISVELAEAGCNTIVHYRTNKCGALQTADRVRETGRKAIVLQANLADRREMHSLAQRVSETVETRSRGLGVLVHNAANFERVDPSMLSESALDNALSLNAEAPYALTIALAKILKASQGSVVAIGCTSAFRPLRNYVPYSISKAALHHVVSGLALALAPEVRVNAVAPGMIHRPNGFDETNLRRIASEIPLRRFGDPGDVSRAVRFLAENNYITGQVIVIDGGRVLT